MTRRRADTSRPAVGSSTSNSRGSWITAVARWTSFACPTLKSLTARRNSGSRSNRSTIFATASASDLPRRPYRPPKKARFSDTRSDRYSAVRWAAYPTMALTCLDCGASPSMLTRPPSGSNRPTTHPIVVVLPAPFGPNSPSVSPGATQNDRSSTATIGPYRLVSDSTSNKVTAGPAVARARRQVSRGESYGEGVRWVPSSDCLDL